MPSKAIESKKRFILAAYIGTGETWYGKIVVKVKTLFWTWRVNNMSEGEIMRKYYELTDRKDVMSLCLKN